MDRLTSQITGEHLVDLEPPRATLSQLALTNKLEMVPVESDVFDVVKHLKAIDPGLHMMADLQQGIYVLYWKGMREDNRGVWGVHEDLVGAYTALDPRIVRLIERIDGQGRSRHDLKTELDRLEARKDREEEARQSELMGPIAEQLRHAIRKDLGAEGATVHLGGSRGIAKARAEARARPRRRRR